MKKLLTFAGVSALALVTAAPNAFGAYGRYDPICVKGNMKKITFLTAQASSTATCPEGSGLTNCKKVKYNHDEDNYVYYDVETNKWYAKDATTQITTATQFFSGLTINDAESWIIEEQNENATGTIKVNGIKSKLIPYAAMYLGDFTQAKAYVYPAGTNTNDQYTMPFQSITTGSTCSLKSTSGNYRTLNVVGAGKTSGSAFDYGNNLTLPTLVGTGSPLTEEEQQKIINGTTLYYVIRYAADCLSNENASCSLDISGTGAVTYTNKCSTGCSAADGGFASPMDSGMCHTYINPSDPEQYTGTMSNSINDTNM